MTAKSKYKATPRGAIRKRAYATKQDDWKPVELPEGGFTIIIDTREQRPLFINSDINIPEEIKFKRAKVEHGDYTIEGYEDQICIERKQQSDFESYISREYKNRTIGKLQRMKQEVKWRGLVVECDYDELYFDPISPDMTKEKVFNHILSFEVHYGMHVFPHRDRETIERKVLGWLARVYKYCKEEERHNALKANKQIEQKED